MGEKLTKVEREIVMRRGGPGHDFDCQRAEIITCAAWDCQVARCCRHDYRWPEAYDAGHRALEEGSKP